MSLPRAGRTHERLAAEFARAFPTLADQLATPILDPEVERLVEGYVELAQRIDRLITARSARALEFYADLLSPELLRPFPAATILELEPARGVAGRIEVAAGAEFWSVPVEGKRCRF